jgi:CheY-like chemotaxis protein
MKILVAQDYNETTFVYRHSLEDRGHEVTVTTTGEDCLKEYHDKHNIITLHSDATDHIQPFDVVVLDYNIPQISGLEVAKEILVVNPHQRIILVIEYLSDAKLESIRKLNRLTGVLNKPFSEQILVDTIEDKSIYTELKNMDVDIDLIRTAELSHEQLIVALDLLRKTQKQK